MKSPGWISSSRPFGLVHQDIAFDQRIDHLAITFTSVEKGFSGRKYKQFRLFDQRLDGIRGHLFERPGSAEYLADRDIGVGSRSGS